MKAMMITNKMKKMLTSILAIALFTTVSFGQGILLEGFAHAIKSFAADKTDNATFKTVGYTDTNNAEVKTFDLLSWSSEAEVIVEANVIRSFNVANIEVEMEEEVEAESWMNERLFPASEETIEVESWMNTSFTESLESSVTLETWMAAPLMTEETVEAEDWMVKPMAEQYEASAAIEAWMIEPMAVEESIETEDWMAQPFTSMGEQTLQVEDWMTEPLEVNFEEEISAEEWMSELFI